MADYYEGIGEIIETQRSRGTLTFEWQIPNFFRPFEKKAPDLYDFYGFGMPDYLQSCDIEVPTHYTSPPFSFCNECWTLYLEPDISWGPRSSKARMEISFDRHTYYPPRTVYFTFAIKTLNGVEEKIEGDQEFMEMGADFGWPEFSLISHLRTHKSRLVPGNVLTIIGVFKSDEPGISLSNRYRNVPCNQKSLLTEESPPDFTLKVGNREWSIHKCILASRSEYFASMFRREWSENTEGEVRFEDIEEDALDSVLKFVYTGEVKDVPVERVCEIYIAAHKFLLEDLKMLCVKSMKENMGPDIVWESLAIAKIYEEKDLEKCALEYLSEEDEKKNLCMKEWKQFEQNHPSIAAEVRKEIIDDWDDESGESDLDESGTNMISL